MRNILSTLAILAALLSTGFTARAQMSYGGEPYSFNHTISQQVETIEIEALDMVKLLEEDAENLGKNHALRIGMTKDVNYDIRNSGRMDLLPNGGRVWRLAFHMADATFTSLNFSTFNIPDGAELYLYTPNREYVIGKFTNKNQMEDGTFYPQELPGEDIVVEYYEPAGVDFEGELVVDQISQGYYDFFHIRTHRGGLGNAEGTCHPNAICYDNTWHAQINSVACYTMTEGPNVYMCSGAMINNTANNGKQYFLSANHCYSGNATFKFYFQYQATTCTGSNGSIMKTATGARVLAKDDGTNSSDFMLLEITGDINPTYDVYLSGWDISTSVPTNPTSCATIHHPGGDIKKLSIPQHIVDGSSAGYSKFWMANWNYETGTTEQGSSGAPLFNATKLIVGQLFAGSSSCVASDQNQGPSGWDLFGKLSNSWENNNNSSNAKKLKPWLDPTNSGATTLQGRWLNASIVETPTVTTSPVTNITPTSATCGGNVTSDGGAEVTARGVCWSTSPNPTLEDSYTVDGYGTGTFTSSLTGLTPNTPYHVRAYATNSAGTAYGEEVSFYTPNDNSTSTGCGGTFSRDFVDGGFESCWQWQYTQNDTYLEYQSSVLLSLNMLHALEDISVLGITTAPFTAFCDSVTPHSGRYAMKLVSGSIRDEYNGELFLPGAIAPLNNTFIDEFLHGDNINVKRPYTEKPTAIKGYYKYLPVDGDAGSITVTLYNGDNVIAEGSLSETNAVGSWTAFNIPITGESYANVTPTHISIIMSASADYNFADLHHCSGKEGSTLWLDDLEFVFQNQLPTVTTSSVSYITSTTAICGGNVTDDGGAEVTARGVCWSTSPNPTISDSHTTDGTGTGSFTSTLSGLIQNTTYYVRAYATNSEGTAYGNEISFSTSCGNVVVEISGNTDLCEGDTATLIATGASTYQWNTGTTGDIFQTGTEGTYSVIGTDTNGCWGAASISVTVHTIDPPSLIVDGEISACNESTATLSVEGSYTSYLWSTGDTTPSIEVSMPGYYWINVTDEYGCATTSEDTHLGVSILIPETPTICMVGVENNHNLIVWEVSSNTNVRNYRIYRENDQANVFELLATIPASMTNAYEDTTANPSVRAYRYKVTAMDICQGETPMSEFHKTIHLTINRGIGESWNLIWTPYEGMEFPSYRLYRGTTPDNLELIATLPSNLTTLTDFEAPEGALYYQIEMVMESSCQLHTRDTTAYTGARSNIVYNGEPAIEGISVYTISELHIYPNPTTGIVTIELANETCPLKPEIQVFDIYGRQLQIMPVTTETTQIDLSQYATGIYVIKVVNEGNVIAIGKVVKE